MTDEEFGFEDAKRARAWLRHSMTIAKHKFDVLWSVLLEDWVVEEAIEGEMSRLEFLKRARRIAKTDPRVLDADRRKGRGKSRPEALPFLFRLEAKRAEAFADYLALQADRDYDVAELRRKLNPKRQMTEGEARDLVLSQAARILPFAELSRLGIPLIGHSAKMQVLPSSAPPDGGERRVRLFIECANDAKEHVATRSRKNLGEDESIRQLANPLPLDGGRWIPVWPGSVLDELRRVSVRLAKSFPWDEAAAAQFVLTGRAPDCSPLSEGSSSSPHRGLRILENGIHPGPTYLRESVTLTVERWISPKSLEKLYRSYHRSGLNIGSHRDHRSPPLRTLEVFHFVVTRLRRTPLAKPDWSGLHMAWNKKAKDPWKYLYPSSFKAAALSGKVAVAFLGSKHWADQSPEDV